MYLFKLKQKNYTRILAIFHILIGLILVFDFWHAGEEGKKDWIFSAICIIASLFLILTGALAKKLKISFDRHLTLLLFEALLMSGGMIYFWSKGSSLVSVSHALLGGDVILFFIYLKKRKTGEKIVVTERKIVIPSMISERVISWNDLSNVVKKDDVLTIDFKNNKLLQTEILNPENINEDEFNRFCKEQLSQVVK